MIEGRQATRILFCADPLDKRHVDSVYEPEAAAADGRGVAYDLLDFEALINDGNASTAVRRVGSQSGTARGVYRGWMLRPEQYGLLFTALDDRGIQLINDLDAYRRCHYLPGRYAALEEMTPGSVWLDTGPEVSMDRVMNLLAICLLYTGGPQGLRQVPQT